MKREREEEQSEISFFVYNPQDKHNASFDLTILGSEKDFYVLQFHRPGLAKVDFYHLYILKGNNECIYSCALSQSNPLEKVCVLDRQYLVYETYALAQDREDAGITFCLYVQIQNRTTIQVDMSLKYLPSVIPSFRRNIGFFPWNVDPAAFNIKVDYSKIIQRTPLWFKARGEVTGTKAYKLMGFWVPTKKEQPDWKWDDEPVFDEESKKNMAFGAESEDKALLSYALFYKNDMERLELSGWCKISSTWGASPDALVTLKNISWEEDTPNYVTKNYPDYEGKQNHGVLEIKSSAKGKLSMEAYFFPQIYMEMMSTGRLWCDLIRYTKTKARVYRVWRHKPTEDTLISLIKHAYQNRNNLQDVVQEEPYVKMRAYFKKLASSLSFVEILSKEEILNYERYQMGKSLPADNQRDYSFLFKKAKRETLSILQEAEANHKLMYGAVNNPTIFQQLIEKQIALYHSFP